ncbi:protein kinase domain-containing protein [Marinimicrobium agarilyticum]|uniref:protein kinase domain-containing protein n=1 Tax=Marinimicrobium agarilyticum TaxID=306546 RepID=UPI00041B2712|nr:protein kinase [Marinimicrobium agarilyticum]
MQIPGYKIIDTLGEGGMARVYLAIQESVEREVALKVLDPYLSKDPTFGERFLSEARIVSRLVHPNIVTVYDMGVHRDYHYLSMEYVPGRDLKHRRFELSLPECVTVVKEVARALDYAGRKGCVHRDVKPDNIMLHDDDGRAVLMDFGIARVVDQTSSMTQTGTTVGTPHYMSPEHARGAPVDSRSDLYSLGVVLFLLLCGHLPYDSDSAVSIGVKHISEQIPLLPRHLVAFQPIIDRILAKDPDERYQTGAEFIDALEQLTPEMLVAIQQEGDRALFEKLGGSDGESPTLHQPQAVVARHDDELAEPEVAEGEPMSIEDEDRVSHQPAKPAEGHRRVWLLSLILFCTLGLVALYQWEAPLRALWQARVMPWVERMSEELPTVVSGEVSQSGEEAETPREVPRAGNPETVQESMGEAEAVEAIESSTGTTAIPTSKPELSPAPKDSPAEPVTRPPVETERPSFEPALAEPLPLPPTEEAQAEAERSAPEPSPAVAADNARNEAVAELSRTADDIASHGDLTGALALLESGLESYPESPRLLMQSERLRARLDQRSQEVTAERAEAERVSPLAATVSAIEEDLAAGRLEEAGERLMQARDRNPGSAELLALEVEWRDRREAEQQPEIPRARVSAESFNVLPDEQADVLRAGRVLHVGFSYRNFAATSAVIQAMLYDGSRQIQIAQVPVIVQGPQGEAFFRIERPVNGFAEGGYHLDLVAGNRTLSSVSFQISD